MPGFVVASIGGAMIAAMLVGMILTRRVRSTRARPTIS